MGSFLVNDERAVDSVGGGARVGYAVPSFGGIFIDNDRSSLKLDKVNKRFVLDVEKERFENVPGFDSNNWPNMADPSRIHNIRDVCRSFWATLTWKSRGSDATASRPPNALIRVAL